jgi:hypothetical protein
MLAICRHTEIHMPVRTGRSAFAVVTATLKQPNPTRD